MDPQDESRGPHEVVPLRFSEPITYRIPWGERVALEPGSYHVMLIGVQETLEPGQAVGLRLTFEKAGEVEVEAEVRVE